MVAVPMPLAVLPERLLMLPELVLAVVVESEACVDNTSIDEDVNEAGPPTSLAGIAEPTPLLVNGVGKVNVDVSGSSSMSP